MIGDILQPTHLLFILVVALLVLGPKRLPEVARSLGRGLRDFRSALNTDDLREQMLSATSMTPTEHETAAMDTSFAAAPDTVPTPVAEPEHQSAQGEASPEPEPAVSAPSPDRAS